MRLYLTRHGETTWNVEGRIQGQGNSDLTALGVRQAERLATRLAQERIDAAYASDLRRAMHTAEIVLAGHDVPVTPDPAWREIKYGEWEGLLSKDAHARDPEFAARRLADFANVAPPGGETLNQVRDRAYGAVERLRAAHAGQHVLVVTHGGTLRALSAALLGLPISPSWPLHASNCGLSIVEWEEDRPRILTWNEMGHCLEPEAVGADAFLAGARG